MRESTYQIARETYQGYRDAAYAATWDIWSKKLNGDNVDIRLFPIDDSAIEQTETIWPAVSDGHLPDVFDWRAIYGQVASTPRRFDVAVWNKSVLVGLCVGMASRGSSGRESNVTLRFLQRAGSAVNPIKGCVAAIMIDAAYAYASILGKPLLYIRDPLPLVESLYISLGFSLAKRKVSGSYLSLKVREADNA